MTGAPLATRTPGRKGEPSDGHDHGIKPSVAVLLGLCILGLLAGIVLAFMQAQATERRLAVLEEYVEGRGEYRDREAERLEQQSTERIRQALCDLLEQLPASALLDRVRDKYECGPGLPPESLPPEVQRELADGSASRPPTSEEDTSSPSAGVDGEPEPTPARAAEPPAQPSPSPTPSAAAPLPSPGPAPPADPPPAGVDLLCGVLPLIC